MLRGSELRASAAGADDAFRRLQGVLDVAGRPGDDVFFAFEKIE